MSMGDTEAAVIRGALTKAASAIEFAEGRQAFVDDALAALDRLLTELVAAKEDQRISSHHAYDILLPRAEAAEAQVAALLTERDTLREALRQLEREFGWRHRMGASEQDVAMWLVMARAVLAAGSGEPTKIERCPQFAPHERHEWYDGVVRRDCPGTPPPCEHPATDLTDDGLRCAVCGADIPGSGEREQATSSEATETVARDKRPASSDGMGEPPQGGTACRDTLKSEHSFADTAAPEEKP